MNGRHCMEKIKILENYVKDLFIIVDEEMSHAQMCNRYNISEKEMIRDQIKDKYNKGDVVLIKKINEKAYTVLPEDNLNKIATKLDCSVDYLVSKNNLKAPVVFVGQRLLY